MASNALLCPSSPLLSNRAGPTALRAVGPCSSVFFPAACIAGKPSRLPALRAQATGDNKDTAVDVHVNNQGNQQQGIAVERQPRRLAVDISPFGKGPLFLDSSHCRLTDTNCSLR
ncbi:small heat shock protein [Sarracenia purpurea var. burkii]